MQLLNIKVQKVQSLTVYYGNSDWKTEFMHSHGRQMILTKTQTIM